MEIGRNSPCPCGSGKKFKRCCGAGRGGGPAVPKERDVFGIVRRTSYVGSLGAARKSFGRSVLAEKRRIFDLIGLSQEKDAARAGGRVQCVEGCFHCCSHFVGGSLQECEGIVYYLYSRKPELKRFLDTYPEWREKIRKHESLFQAVSLSYRQLVDSGGGAGLAAGHRELSNLYYSLSIECPFLNGGKCGIYPARPYGCASLFSLSRPESCDPRSPGPPDQRSVVGGYRERNYFFRENPVLIVSNVPLMVYEILKGGVWYLAGLTGLEGMDREMFSDPAAARLLRSVRVP